MDLNTLMAAMVATAKPKLTPVTVEGWGTLYVRPPTVQEVDEAAQRKDADAQEGRQRRFARSAATLICDEHGALLFDAANKEHIELLASQPWSMLHQVLEAAKVVGGEAPGN